MNHEDLEQISVFAWAEAVKCQYPMLRLMYHVPNERKCSQAQGALLKRKGVKSGVPDIILDYPCNGYHGLRIELKYGRNKPSENQLRWLEMLDEQGYKTAVCYGAKEAINEIVKYLEGEQ